jgi:chromate reductase
MINILGFAGSLRRQSYNRALLRACREMLPQSASLEIFELDNIPPFNQDNETSLPPKAAEFKQSIKKSDALLIVTPEYNFSVPGVLKNAIDWASRPFGDNSFAGKVAAIMSASPGMLGGARAQYHLRQVLVCLDVQTLNKPEVFVTYAAQKFDTEGRLIDEPTRAVVKTLLKNLVERAAQAPGGN